MSPRCLEAGTVGELGIAHHTELVTAGELQGMEVAAIFVNTFLELIFWNQIHQLREDGLSNRHSESKLDKYYIQQNEIFIEKITNRHNKLNINQLEVLENSSLDSSGVV